MDHSCHGFHVGTPGITIIFLLLKLRYKVLLLRFKLSYVSIGQFNNLNIHNTTLTEAVLGFRWVPYEALTVSSCTSSRSGLTSTC